MKKGRFLLLALGAFGMVCLMQGAALAGFGFGGDDTGKSGLDLNRGYDINTVTTMSGKVTTLPRQIEKEHVVIEIRSGHDPVSICVGPHAYWEAKGVLIKLNDELSVKGAIAQGQDGKTYLLAQKLMNKTTGTQVELRNEKGMPSWSGRNMNAAGSGRTDGGMRNQGGGMMRGGGGGMMRR
ncbi:DNA-binding protein [Geobacter pelophilus]|uniref:DNA-binding protein n=1 Tax=Geoanaerobacter pelophilus TaxID=60036 RepID=A0AAW4L028_9BACT|nr:DNA-binding protein [Geoanaerobacter pelophilus]MBT0664263.1 DNA-binding protein [Geoanaerobacter pelophilus]